MKLSPQKELESEVLYKTLIGKEIEIIESKIKNQIGLKGVIVYESASFFHVEVQKGTILHIFKQNIRFKTVIQGKPLNIDGRLLFSTIVYRIKKIK